MTPAECMRVLGLGETAHLPEIKHAYRQLAQQLHPDKQNGSETSRQRFIEVSHAYRTLVRIARATEAGRPVGICTTCLSLGEVIRGLDGELHCPQCSLGRRRFLPLPMIEVVRCTLAILIMSACAYLLLQWMRQPSFTVAAAALGLALLGMLTLAITCLRVLHCLPPKRSRDHRA